MASSSLRECIPEYVVTMIRAVGSSLLMAMMASKPTHVGHLKIHQCHVGIEFTVKLHSFLTGRRLPDQLHVGLRGNQGPDPRAQQWMVVH